MLPVRIRLSTPAGIAITWEDGHQSLFPSVLLRRSCPCATCSDNEPQVNEDSPEALPILGQEPIRATGASQIGHYAIQFFWNDGHGAGIYTFDYLRGLCPCDSCSAGG